MCTPKRTLKDLVAIWLGEIAVSARMHIQSTVSKVLFDKILLISAMLSSSFVPFLSRTANPLSSPLIHETVYREQKASQTDTAATKP